MAPHNPIEAPENQSTISAASISANAGGANADTAPSTAGQEQAIFPRECKACGHTWVPRQLRTPRRCPQCSSATWETGRKRPPLREMIAAKAARTSAADDTKKAKGTLAEPHAKKRSQG